MPCLCAPTTHEGSFRCRLHRGSNISNNSAISQKGVLCSSNLISDLSCVSITAHESPSAPAPHPDDYNRPPFSFHAACSQQVAADHRSSLRTRSSSSSSSSPSPSSSSSSLSSPSPLPSFYCTRPPPAKRPSSSSSSPSKSPYPRSSSLSTPSWRATSSGTSCPSASHAAALAILMQHLHNKQGRNHNRTMLRSPADLKIGPSRLSRMVVACAEELPLLKEDYCISNSPQHSHTPAGSYIDASTARRFASFQATQISLKTLSSANKFKQSETSCRIVGSKGGSLIMPTVY